VTPWMTWFLACWRRAISRAEQTVTSIAAKARFWTSAAAAGLNQRQRSVVARLFERFENKLTTTKWAKLTKCSQDTAHRDIMDLVNRGILVRSDEGGRSTSYSVRWPS
jgi:Fic family protein